MFIGNYAVALAAKRAVPSVSLGVLFLACQLSDLIWPVLVLLGIEQVEVDPSATVVTPLNFIHYPYSHSLVTNLLFAAILGSIVGRKFQSFRIAIVSGATVLSHWFLDFLSHRPDLPLFPGSASYGLGLWNSLNATIIVEGLMFLIGLFLYQKATNGAQRPRVYWSLIGFLLVIYVGNVLGPKPDAGTPAAAIAGPALAMWILVWWAGIADHAKKT